jgi:drug/metabolite transporter (DMT)-like permease
MGGPALSQKSGYAGQPLPQGEILTTKRALQQRKTPDWQHDRKIDMLNAETLAITYGIGSALAWGAGDFSGGFATKRGSVFTVILYSQIIGGLLLVGLQVVWGERPPEFRHLAWGGAAGLFGVLGLVALYKGLATGRMGIVAPLSAVLTAVVPLLFAFVVEGIPKSTQLIGFGGALMAVWLFSSTRGPGSALKSEILLSLSAGLGFGLFFICIDRVSGEAILWPLIAARCASVVTMALVLGCRGQLCLPHSNLWPFIALAGVLDAAGNAFFALASRVGRLDVSAVLASMYPAATVILARYVLKETLGRRQQLGLAVACIALCLIAI